MLAVAVTTFRHGATVTQGGAKVRVVGQFGAVVLSLFMIGCEAAEFGNPYAGRAMPTPGRVSGERSYVQVAAGFFHSCGLTTAGAAFCWGSNEYRQLGTTQSLPQCELRPCSRTPLPVTGSHVFTQLASSMSRSCGLVADGSAWCWGGGWEANGGGWLGDGAPQTSAVPVRVAADSPFVAITLGTGHGCALTASGMAFCWGQNGHGQVGDSSKVDRPTPVPVAGGRRFRSISAGGLHTCAIASDGAAWCWGSNRYGQLGIGDVPYNAFTFARIHPGRVLGQHGWSVIIAGGEHSCGIDTAGAAWCWGRNDNAAQLGDASGVSHRGVPALVATQVRFDALAAGEVTTCGHTTGNASWCWGSNYFGALGNGRTNPGGVAAPVATLGGPYASVSVGGSHACAVATTGAILCWGDSFYGQLGR